MKKTPVIGIDFDNTIISYDESMHRFSVLGNYIEANTKKNKKVIRENIRQLPDGELKWQKLQSEIYGRNIMQAHPAEGVFQFINECKKYNYLVYIISHKTEFSSYDKTVNLRKAALNWMQKNDFFDVYGLNQENLFFEPTRHKKIQRIKELNCSHFIDDLEETFLESLFPENVKKLLYAPGLKSTSVPNVTLMNSWSKIVEYFFRV